MTNKRFTIQSTATELELYDNGKQIGEFTHHEWVARSVDYVVDLLNSLWDENRELRKKYDNLNSALEKTARDMTEKMIYEMEDFDVFQRITDYVEELDE